jgi:hypothetical protein
MLTADLESETLRNWVSEDVIWKIEADGSMTRP